MKINITKKQYKALLELIYLGEWTVNSWRTSNRMEEYSELNQYFYSFAKEFGMDDLIIYDKEFSKYYPTREFEILIDDFIDDNDDEVFWSELVIRLAKKKVNNLNVDHLSRDEQFKMLMKIEEEYEREFEKNGIENLEVSGLE